jgi:hypothetical protein
MQMDYDIHLGSELEVCGYDKHSALVLAVMVGVHLVHQPSPLVSWTFSSTEEPSQNYAEIHDRDHNIWVWSPVVCCNILLQ